MYALNRMSTHSEAVGRTCTTTAAASSGVIQTPPVRLLTYFMVGTLGLATPAYVELRSATSTWAQAQRAAAPNQSSTARAAPTPASQLDRIRKVLKASVADTAAVFGVTRQALYNWRAGESISASNLAKLDDLSAAADALAAAGLDDMPQLARRKLAGGKTLLETVRDGSSARDAASALIQMLEREQVQRERIERRLAGRRTPSVDTDDAGAPSLNERA